MPQARRYYRHSRITEPQFCELMRYFAEDRSATEVASLTSLTRKSVTTIFLKLRQRIAEHCERHSPITNLDPEAFSCSQCVCGRCRPTASRNAPLFALLTLNDCLFTALVPDCRKPILRALIHGRIAPEEMPVNGWHGYDGLVDTEFREPMIVEHRDARAGIGNAAEVVQFWDFARRRLEKFNGVSRRTFYLHLKESEWRFNLADRDLYAELLNLVERHPL
jgi:transposase